LDRSFVPWVNPVEVSVSSVFLAGILSSHV
jgi:hypothetical protein